MKSGACLAGMLLAALSVSSSPVSAQEPAAANGATVIAPGVGYATAVRLRGAGGGRAGKLLLAFEAVGRKGVPIYQSLDDGRSWSLLSRVVDAAHGGAPDWQVNWQPNLYQLPRGAGPLPAGTLLFAANASRATDKGEAAAQDLQVYASSDGGRSWSYRGSIVHGDGRPEDQANHAVWEPNLRVLDDGRLVAYYSSEQHKAEGYNQLLAHRVSEDGGRTWGAETIDVAVGGGVERPGMAVVDRLPDGRYVMSYEDIDGPKNGQVYVKFSRDGLDWGRPSDRGFPVETPSGAYPVASPTVTWLPLGGPKGVLAVVAQRGAGGGDPEGRDLYLNDDLGVGPWRRVPAPARKATGNIHAGWTQAVLPASVAGRILHITSSSSAEAPRDAAQNTIIAAEGPLDLDRWEAEDGVRSEGAAVVPDGSASAAWKMRISATPDARVRFALTTTQAGAADLVLRVRTVGAPAAAELSVNGARLAPAAPSLAQAWTLVRTPVVLKSGVNWVDVGAVGGALDLDWIELHAAAPGPRRR